MTKAWGGRKWGDEDIDAIGQMMLDGLSASQIGYKFDVSRNTIIGIAQRHLKALGVRFAQRKAHNHMPRVRRVFLSARPRIGKTTPQPEPAPVEFVPKKIALENLGPADCRWPVGDPLEEGFGFCGHVKLAGSPYCPAHHVRSIVRAAQ